MSLYKLSVYEQGLLQALKSAVLAQENIDRERLRLGKPLANKKFWTASEMKAEVRAAVDQANRNEVKNRLALIEAVKSIYVKDNRFAGFATAFKNLDTPQGKAYSAFISTFAKGYEVERRERENRRQATDSSTSTNTIEATAEAIVRAAAIARGEIPIATTALTGTARDIVKAAELARGPAPERPAPTGLAAQIIAAGKKRRGEA